MNVKNLVSFNTDYNDKSNKLLDIIKGADDCVLTLYLPYTTILEIVPANELRKFKDDKTFGHRRKGNINSVAQSH